jgi:hypothetical protein
VILDVALAYALLLQQQTGSQLEPGLTGVLRLFAGLGLVLTIFTVALTFTWWISKDE